MIRFDLACENGHRFDSWFRNGESCETLLSHNQVECPSCGTTAVLKALMAPAISRGDAPASEYAKLQALRRHVLENAEYVGDRFAEEVRAMEDDPDLKREIYGEASKADVEALLDDGISICPMPPAPVSN